MANTRGTDTPSDCATCWSKAVARIASPCLEAVKNQAKPAMMAMEIVSEANASGIVEARATSARNRGTIVSE